MQKLGRDGEGDGEEGGAEECGNGGGSEGGGGRKEREGGSGGGETRCRGRLYNCLCRRGAMRLADRDPATNMLANNAMFAPSNGIGCGTDTCSLLTIPFWLEPLAARPVCDLIVEVLPHLQLFSTLYLITSLLSSRFASDTYRQ